MALWLLTSRIMQGTIRCVLIAGSCLGCDTGDIDVPDAPPGTSGLVVEWSSAPADWPSDLGDGVTIDRARFALDSLRVVGDAGPGDPRTTASAIEMRFAWTDRSERPVDITFDDAPPGLYSQVALAFDGHTQVDSYEIRGEAVVGGQQLEYRIEDSDPLAFNVGIDQMVNPGASAAVKLRINFVHALDSLDFATLDMKDGKLELEQGDPQMATFRAKLVESFEIVDAGSSGAR